MSARTPLMAANWKMHFTVDEAVALVEELNKGITRFDDREVVVAPPFTRITSYNVCYTKLLRVPARFF